jgi:hypothetical protein
MVSTKNKLSALADTSYLITLFDDSRPHHKVAKKYYRYCLDNSVTLYLSAIVVSEFHQMQSIVDIVGSGNFRMLPFNYDDGLQAADVAYQLGGVERKRDGTNPKYKDDLKLIAQARVNEIDFILTEDESTLVRYCKRLSDAGLLKAAPIVMSAGFDASPFNDGQSALSVDD